jgi:hypothetical protein
MRDFINLLRNLEPIMPSLASGELNDSNALSFEDEEALAELR